ncbi:STAS domain-containing protein [Streptomyces spectabilis]|uniref:STAS domain-containing protein n=1 Tax=Streptomyces spectabilis TaxID=68270 RepID=UPI0033CD2F48
MRGYFADDLLLMMPSGTCAGVRLFGEVVSAHRAPLAVALTEQSKGSEEITLDLTGVRYFANSALEILVALSRHLRPPQRLVVRAAPALGLRERLAAQGWDGIATLRLIDA